MRDSAIAHCGGSNVKRRSSLLPAHPGRLLKRELVARKLSANKLSLDIGVPSGRITDILNGRRSITADTAVRLGRYFGNAAQFWLDLQSQYDIGVVEREKGGEIAKRVRPADAA
jgi:antitoxin HigA-1